MFMTIVTVFSQINLNLYFNKCLKGNEYSYAYKTLLNFKMISSNYKTKAQKKHFFTIQNYVCALKNVFRISTIQSPIQPENQVF